LRDVVAGNKRCYRVGRRADSSQEDGWLLALRHDLREHRSALVVLDARDLEAGPLAVAHLDHHIQGRLPWHLHIAVSRRKAFLPHPNDIPIR
jgi:all-trans-8'-apo-beta-carotenal 15,15'-oxygenase